MIKHLKFFRPFIIFWFVRTVTNIVLFLIERTSEIPPAYSELIWSVTWSFGEISVFSIVSFYIFRIPFIRRVYIPVLTFLLLFFILWSIADPIIFSLAGDHLTPSLLSHFAGWDWGILSSNYLWEPIMANLGMVSVGLIIFSLLIFIVNRLVISAIRQDLKKVQISQVLGLLCGGLVVMTVSYFSASSSLAYPPEIIYARDYFGLNVLVPDENAISNLREFVDPGHDIKWTSDEYPLVRLPKSDTANRSNPDIIMIVVESMRGRGLKLFNERDGEISVPGIERFAGEGVVFPYFISNGFPSSEGFISILTGGWPHSRKRIVQNYPQHDFFNLAAHLNNAGYNTLRIEDYAWFDGVEPIVRHYYDSLITFEDRMFPSEKNMIDGMIEYIKYQDEFEGKPFYTQLKTRNPHYPYHIANDEKGEFESIGDPSDNYPVSIAYVDEHIDRLHDFLNTRERKNNTLVIIVGDHSNVLDRSTATGLPVDDFIWTGAVISGPEELIGKPRRLNIHTSQADILPTILSFVETDAPIAFLGKNMLDNTLTMENSNSVAIRPAGVRIDRGGYSYIVDRRHPASYVRKPSFDGRMLVGQESLISENEEPEFEPKKMLEIVDSWSYLVEMNKFWKDEFYQQEEVQLQ